MDLPNKKERQVFLENSNYGKVFLENLTMGLQRLMPKLWQKLLDRQQECSLYFIGAQNGLLEFPLLESIIQQRGSAKRLNLTCQGVSVEKREEFRQDAEEKEFSHLNIEYQVVPFEEPLYIEPHAHITVAPYEWLDIVSWNNTPHEHNSLVKFRNSLCRGGIGLMVFPYSAGDRFLLLHRLKSLAGIIAGEDVVEELTHHQVRHQSYIVETIVNTQCCFSRFQFCATQEGEQLLSYLLQGEWQSLSDQAKKNVGEKMTELRAHYGKPQMVLQHLFLWIFSGAPHQRDLEKAEIAMEEKEEALVLG